MCFLIEIIGEILEELSKRIKEINIQLKIMQKIGGNKNYKVDIERLEKIILILAVEIDSLKAKINIDEKLS